MDEPSMKVEETANGDDAALSGVQREKTAPFLIRAFVKVGGFHRLSLFEDGTLPIADETQLFTWKDATLRELLTTLRLTAPPTLEHRHPLARYSFRAVYADSATRGRFAQKDLGLVYSRDILGEPGSILGGAAPRLLKDEDERDGERTLEELRFHPGDYMCVALLLPKNAVTAPPAAAAGEGGLSIKGAGVGNGVGNGWKGRGDGGWGGAVASTGPPAGRGGGHWRGDSGPGPTAPGASRGMGIGLGRGGRDRDREFDRDRPDRERRGTERRGGGPPRGGRDSPPHTRGNGWGARGGRNRSKSRSRSRSPPPRRRGRYD
ncbi:hypothetical protein PLICRDRAFT_693069 [Plicaturopsis crispa FD-325 SS-3]|nr:hypothetical protein PLICRDRAFT_693069 [Plicaturopsis crispa FD-325 SS-3]